MPETIDEKNIDSKSYRFSGYKLKRDRNNNIILEQRPVYQPEYWKTRATSR